MNKSLFVILASFLLIMQLSARQSTRLIQDWEYVKGDLGSPWEAFRPLKQSKLPIWTAVTIPHCFNAYDAVDPDVAYYEGEGWYRTFLNVDNPYQDGRTLLHFEGAGQKTKVYVFQTLVGEHVGGYDEFDVDITAAVEAYKKENPEAESIPIAVRCDNSRDVEMIPSDLSDFNVYGGLYRYVNLLYVPVVSLDKVLVDYDLADNYKSVEVSVSSSLALYDISSENVSLKIALRDAQGQILAEKTTNVSNNTGSDVKTSFTIKKPKLWHPDTPHLYELSVTVTAEGGSDVYEDKIGFVDFEFVEKGPFKVNGERLLLRGTHRHEDHAGMAAAMTEDLIRQEMVMMKEMGINFIRLGHYQQSGIVLDLCDSLGLFVWEEIPWCRGGLGGEVYKEQARRMLRNMITQHYNHVSVITWGLGNENDWPGDFDEFDEQKIRAFMSELNDIAHSMDNKRKTSIRRCDFCKDVIDVYSPSIWAGWYRGKYTNYAEVSYTEAMKVNHFLHVEWGASNHAGRHSESPDEGLSDIMTDGADERDGDFLMTGGVKRASKDGDWSESYACNLIDWHLKEQEKMDWLTGTAYWPFKDFSTPLRPENPVPYVNQKGVIQRDFTKKEAFYVFQSYWTEKPMARIYGHTWPVRYGEEGQKRLVKVYSNCEEAELFLNGESVGLKQRDSQQFPAAGLCWNLAFETGKNQLRVVANKGKVTVSDELEFVYQTEKWGTPSNLALNEIAREANVVTLEAKLYDKNGVFCPDGKNLVEFGITGNGHLLDNLGTWDGSRKIQLYNGRAMIKVMMDNGKAVASVKAEGVETGFVTVSR